MSYAFEIRLEFHRAGFYWFKVKGRYVVHLDEVSGKAECTCQGDTFRQGGRKQKVCKHIQQAREVLKVLKEGKHEQRTVNAKAK